MTIMVSRTCDLCGRRIRISLDKMRKNRDEHRKNLCGPCLSRERIGWYDHTVINTD